MFLSQRQDSVSEGAVLTYHLLGLWEMTLCAAGKSTFCFNCEHILMSSRIYIYVGVCVM